MSRHLTFACVVAVAIFSTSAGAVGDDVVFAEFRQFMSGKCPNVRYQSEDRETITLKHVTLSDLAVAKSKLLGHVAATVAAGAPRAAVYEGYCEQINAAVADTEVSRTADAKRLMPRLVRADWLTGSEDRKLPQRALGDTGLHVVYVLDSPDRVAYVGDRQQAQLKMSEPELYAQALANLSVDKKAVEDALRKALTEKAMVVLKTGDTFDAARLLLVPGLLKPGQSVAAVVSDRDTLVLLSPPPDGDWATLIPVAEANDGEPLLRVPVQVTSAGVVRKGTERR